MLPTVATCWIRKLSLAERHWSAGPCHGCAQPPAGKDRVLRVQTMPAPGNPPLKHSARLGASRSTSADTRHSALTAPDSAATHLAPDQVQADNTSFPPPPHRGACLDALFSQPSRPAPSQPVITLRLAQVDDWRHHRRQVGLEGEASPFKLAKQGLLPIAPSRSGTGWYRSSCYPSCQRWERGHFRHAVSDDLPAICMGLAEGIVLVAATE